MKLIEKRRADKKTYFRVIVHVTIELVRIRIRFVMRTSSLQIKIERCLKANSPCVFDIFAGKLFKLVRQVV